MYTLTVVCVGTLTPVPTTTVTNVCLLTTSLTVVAAELHAIPATHAHVAVRVVVTGPYVSLPANIAMILLRGVLTGVI